MNAIYARVSTDEQARKGYSLPDQLQTGHDYFNSIGVPNVEEFIDDGYSGEFLDRPALNRLRDKVYAGLIKHVWVLDPDRLSRDDVHAFMLKEEIEKNATLFFHTGNYDKTPEGKLFFKIRASVATFEKEKIRDRTTRGKRAKALQGKLTHNDRPLGYDYDSNNSMYVINPQEAETIKTIFNLYITQNLGTQRLADELNALGLKTKNGKPFIRSTVLRIIKNEMYCGTKQTYKRYDKKIGHKKTKQSARKPEEWISVPVPAIIDRETWERAQAIRLNNKHTSQRNSKYEYLIKNIIKCGECGAAMIGASWADIRTEKQYHYYRCLTKQTKNKCKGKMVPAETIDNMVWDYFVSMAKSRQGLSRMRRESSVSVDVNALTETITELKKKQSGIIRWVKNGIIDMATAEKDLKDINRQIIDIQQRISAQEPVVNIDKKDVLQAVTYEEKRAQILKSGIKIKAWKNNKDVDFTIL